ncbi:hypothetical protein HCJ66_04755 [Listeria sp. FSL L7-1582]|uniref:hypothetical protein n=1 Tax=Listeria portnoyi TaxID=2713504 RepID=UPI00164D1D17|nr:hypothetical protein [Listeria portnoyi]MBC6308863.1 hypothetical protein [Listeria portnoyi]
MKKMIAATLVLGFLGVFTVSGFVNAGTTKVNYSTTVGKLNGSGYTGYQAKTTAGTKADLYSLKTGNYNVDVRTTSSGSNGTWSRDVNNATTRQLSNSHNKGTNVRLQFSNDITTTVNVQASGSWRSN